MKLSCPLPRRFSWPIVFFYLLIPPAAKSETRPTVKAGETLSGIAQKYCSSVAQLRETKALSDTEIYPGQRLDGNPEEIDANAKEVNRKEMDWGAKPAPILIQGIGSLVAEKDRELLVRVAKGFLGLKYSRGGSTIKGMDCSAFVRKVFSIFGIELPRTAREQFQIGSRVTREDLQMGDLVFFKRSPTARPTHVGIYIGDGQFIHTSLRKRRVDIDRLDSRYFSTRFLGGRRVEEAQRSLEKTDWTPTFSSIHKE